MNIIQELSDKFPRESPKVFPKNANRPFGKYFYQPESRILDVDGTKITLEEIDGAIPLTESFRIVLQLKKAINIDLTIFPKDLWNNFLDFILPKRRRFIPKTIRKQFWFGGNENLLKQLASDKIFVENINNENVYIETIGKPTNLIVLTPANGIKDLNHLEKIVAVLKQIETTINKQHTTAYKNNA